MANLSWTYPWGMATYSSNVFGDSDLDNSIIRMQFVYAWHRDMENIKKLQSGH
jgi:hypothetical protein